MRSVSAELRPLMEVIDRKVREGAALVDIQAALNEDGLKVSFDNLRWNLREYRRKKRENVGAEAKSGSEDTRGAGQSGGEKPESAAGARGSNARKVATDVDVPLTRAKLREIRNRPFNWETMKEGDDAEGNKE